MTVDESLQPYWWQLRWYWVVSAWLCRFKEEGKCPRVTLRRHQHVNQSAMALSDLKLLWCKLLGVPGRWSSNTTREWWADEWTALLYMPTPGLLLWGMIHYESSVRDQKCTGGPQSNTQNSSFSSPPGSHGNTNIQPNYWPTCNNRKQNKKMGWYGKPVSHLHPHDW